MIELTNVTRTYDTGKVKVHALKSTDLKISRGEFVAIMGHSGSGKSTLLSILGFLDKPDTGSYRLFHREITELEDDELSILRNQIAGFVFQQFHLLPRMTVKENTGLPLIYAGKKDQESSVIDKIKSVGLSHRESHYSNELSGGEQQRVAIARSIVNEPMILFTDEPTGNLDSKSGEEVLSILESLNNEGKTIIMVTHEKDIAARAKRIIHMRDGKIISDKKNAKRKRKGHEQIPDAEAEDIISNTAASFRKAEFGDFIRQAVGSIITHKMRTFLSMLGILIGVAAVISMLAIGEGAKEEISKKLSSMGSNLLKVRSGSGRHRGVSLGAGSVTRFTIEDARAISKIQEVRTVSPAVRGGVQLVYGNKNWRSQVQGVGVDYEKITSSQPVAGHFFTEKDLRMRKKVALVGTTIVSELFDNNDPVGSIMKINRINFKVIGVLPEKGASPWRDKDDIVIIPVTTAMHRLLGKEYVDYIDAEIKDISLIDKAKESISNLIIKRHRLSGNSLNSFNIRDMTEIREAITSTTRTMSWLLGAVASISLLVGGIGIMNIMLVTVKERTKEIGLRKAVGARRIDILLQFLIESSLLTCIGGVAGITLGSAISIALASMAGWPVKISLFSITIATLFSITVGIFFGLWPALQASRLKPVEALRYE